MRPRNQTPRSRRAPAILFTFCAVLLVSCDESATTAPSAAPSPSATEGGASIAAGSSQAQLVAAPNPVPPGQQPGTTTISWQTGTGKVGELWVKVGRRERLFKRGKGGSHVARFIRAGETEFLLYDGTERQKLLAQVKVTRPKVSKAPGAAGTGAPPSAGPSRSR